MIQKSKKAGVVLALLCLSIIGLHSPSAAQDAIQVTDQSWNSEFNDQLIFTLNAESSAEIQEVDLLYRVVSQLATTKNAAEFTPGTSVAAEFEIDLSEPGNYLPPGAELEYWWKITDADGNELKTEKERLLYLDNRHDWQELQNDRVTLFWYNGDEDFGQALFDRANVALDTLESDIGIALEEPIKIFIYGDHGDLMSALSTTAQEWTGGVAYTEFGVVLIGIAPRQLDWGLNAMTHEMSHLVIHQATDNPFGGMPRWLDEGIAVYNENRDELDQDFALTFNRAVANDELMTLRTLSSPFPADPMQANLAYGQSGAVVKFIVDTYGTDAMAELLAIFAEGALYDEALEQALGVNTDALDNAFRESVGLAPWPGTEMPAEENTAVEEAKPEEELVIEEEAAQPEVEPEQESEVQEEAAAAAAETEPVQEESASVEAAPAEESSGGVAGLIPCLGGIIALLLLGGLAGLRQLF